MGSGRSSSTSTLSPGRDPCRRRTYPAASLGHSCFRRSAGFRVGDIGVVKDRGMATVVAHIGCIAVVVRRSYVVESLYPAVELSQWLL